MVCCQAVLTLHLNLHRALSPDRIALSTFPQSCARVAKPLTLHCSELLSQARGHMSVCVLRGETRIFVPGRRSDHRRRLVHGSRLWVRCPRRILPQIGPFLLPVVQRSRFHGWSFLAAALPGNNLAKGVPLHWDIFIQVNLATHSSTPAALDIFLAKFWLLSNALEMIPCHSGSHSAEPSQTVEPAPSAFQIGNFGFSSSPPSTPRIVEL